MARSSIIPYTCVYIDSDFKDIFLAAKECLSYHRDRNALIKSLEKMWISEQNPNAMMPILSVRTGFDLFLRVKNYPPGSEVIMSAINIPTMAYIVRQYGLKIIPIDVSIETVAPKVELLEHLVTDKTVAVLVAHLYGKWFDMDPVIAFGRKYNVAVIEDCAECFQGFDHLGHPGSDISLFSFGIIKYYTSFGGAIAKVRDREIFEKMSTLHGSYSIQSHLEYLKKLLKYSVVYAVLNCPRINQPGVYLTQKLNIDHKKIVVDMMRGFPNNMMEKIKQQPSTALLYTMVRRQSSFHSSEFCLRRLKGEYIHSRLPSDLEVVGTKSEWNNYWLFPILVDNPDSFSQMLQAFGVDAYRGATQLNLIEPENGNSTMHPAATVNSLYPHEAKYLIDHVLYLPVNKNVPFHVLDRIVSIVKTVIRLSREPESHRVKLPSKL